MQNSENTTYYYIPDSEPQKFRQIDFDMDIAQEMINVLASGETLEEIATKVDDIFLENTFLELI